MARVQKRSAKSARSRVAKFNPPFKTIIILGLLLFAVSGWLWWRNVAATPERVFYDMLDNSMRARSMSRQVLQQNTRQSLDQKLQLQTGQQQAARSLTLLKQSGTSDATVTTESIGTPYEDYVRYVSIQTNQKGQDGKPFNFDNVTGVWGKSERQRNVTSGELYSEAVLDVVPFGFLNAVQRGELLRLIREQKVYDIDFGKTKREVKNLRPQYTYSATISPEKYVAMLKQFGKAAGLTHLEEFDPESYRNSPPLEVEIMIDIISRQLIGVNFLSSLRQEIYSSHGAESDIALPNQTIPVDELQKRLQAIQ